MGTGGGSGGGRPPSGPRPTYKNDDNLDPPTFLTNFWRWRKNLHIRGTKAIKMKNEGKNFALHAHALSFTHQKWLSHPLISLMKTACISGCFNFPFLLTISERYKGSKIYLAVLIFNIHLINEYEAHKNSIRIGMNGKSSCFQWISFKTITRFKAFIDCIL